MPRTLSLSPNTTKWKYIIKKLKGVRWDPVKAEGGKQEPQTARL